MYPASSTVSGMTMVLVVVPGAPTPSGIAPQIQNLWDGSLVRAARATALPDHEPLHPDAVAGAQGKLDDDMQMEFDAMVTFGKLMDGTMGLFDKAENPEVLRRAAEAGHGVGPPRRTRAWRTGA